MYTELKKKRVKIRPINRNGRNALWRSAQFRISDRPQLWIPNGAEQRMPAVEVLPFCDQVDGQEKPSATRVLTAGSFPSFTQMVTNTMKGKGNQIQSHQCVRQPVAAVAEIVLHVVAIVFQQIKAFIFNLPTRPSACDNGFNVALVHFQGSNKAKSLCGFVGCDIADPQLDIVDLQCVIAASDGQPVIGPQVAVLLVRFVASRGFLDLYLVRPVNAGKIIEQRFVIVCFNTEDKISTGIDDPLAHRLFGIEVIAQINRPQRGVAPGVFLEPPIGGLGLAVLFFVTVLRRHELWTQRHGVAVANANHGGAQYRVVVFGFTAIAKSVAALRTMDAVRVVELGPVQCDQASAIEHLEWLKCLIFFHYIQCNIESRIEVLALDPIQLHTDVGVGWQLGNAKKRAADVFAMGFFKHSLVFQKRWRLNEKSRERAHRNVVKGVLFVAAVAGICDILKALSQSANQMVGHQFHVGVS